MPRLGVQDIRAMVSGPAHPETVETERKRPSETGPVDVRIM
jgi:hypothetical protein